MQQELVIEYISRQVKINTNNLYTPFDVPCFLIMLTFVVRGGVHVVIGQLVSYEGLNLIRSLFHMITLEVSLLSSALLNLNNIRKTSFSCKCNLIGKNLLCLWLKPWL
jgi:hypothetical protein